MRRTLGTIGLLVVLLGGILGGAAAITASTPPPDPGPVRPSSIAGCWKWDLVPAHRERRVVTIDGVRHVQFRSAATVLRWCPTTGYEVVEWRTPWGPGLR